MAHTVPSAPFHPRPPRGFLHGAFKLPTLLYHAHLGWVVGHRFLMLTHRGRRTGWVHETVLEVLHYDPVTQESVVFSGRGRRADWYRNITAHPVLTGEEATRFISQWAREHRWEARLVAPVLRRLGWSGAEAATHHGFPRDAVLVAFRPLQA